MVFTGTAILCVGWFGFTAGSASAANEIAAWRSLTPSWRPLRLSGVDLWRMGLANLLLGACSGAIAGLVGVTPACAYRCRRGADHRYRLWPGGIRGRDCAETLARVDDPCDVFGVHGVCGIVGCILTGIFAATSLGGVGSAEGVTMGHQLLVTGSIAITVVWSGVVAFIGSSGGYDRRAARAGRAGARRAGRQQPWRKRL